MVSYQCRTCCEDNVGSFYSLQELLDYDRHPKKTVADFLWDIAKINNNTEVAKRLPQDICGECSRKLKNTYSFVLQAQAANKKLQATLYIENVKTYTTKELIDKQNDCLLESPIDIPIRQTEIKKEVAFEQGDEKSEQGDEGNEQFVNIGKNECEIVKTVDEIEQFVKDEVVADVNAGENDSDSISTEGDVNTDPITTGETSWYKEKDDSDGIENLSNLDNNLSEDNSDTPLLKRRRLGQLSTQTFECTFREDDGRYHCNKCPKDFAWKKDAKRHLLLHSNIYPYKCTECSRLFQRKDKFDKHMEVHSKREQRNSHKRKVHSKRNSEFEQMVLDSNLQPDINDSETSDDDSDQDKLLTKQQRSRRSSTKKPEFTYCNDDCRYHCNRCNKDFAWKKDVERHIKSHFGIFPFECIKCHHRFQRKDKFAEHLKIHAKREKSVRRPRPIQWNFAEHLYTEQRFLSVECKLCTEVIPNIKTLRQHMPTHNEVHTLHLDAESDVIKELFPNFNGDIIEIKENICKDIRHKLFAKYYAIVNAYGYEMALSDSDSENDSAGEKYECELCHVKLGRKYQLFQHSKSDHSQDKLPHKCNVCKLEFVNTTIFEKHSRTQCRNKDRKYQCLKCPGKFVWVQNLQGHKCSNRLNVYVPKRPEQRKRNLLRCNFCDKTFRYATDLKRHQETHNLKSQSHVCPICSQPFLKAENLRQHLRQDHEQIKRRIECCLCGEKLKTLAELRVHLSRHSDGWTGIRYTEGQYFKIHWPQGCQGKEGEVERSIIIDFAGQNLTNYYSAVDESGNELDLYDSESDFETDKKQNGNPISIPYTCDLCGEVFFRRTRILQHQHSAHADGEDSFPHACSRCEKRFVCLGLLEQHYKRDCGNIYKRFDCKRCSARFVWEANLQQHMQRQHIDPEQQISRQLANKLQCDQCNKVFIWPKDLTRHKRIHMPDDEKFECLYCERKFYRKDHLQTHLKVHGSGGSMATTTAAASKRELIRKVNAVDPNLCRPNGCKCVQCKICLSKHTKIADLRTHILEHRTNVSLSQHVTSNSEISLLFYPDEAPMSRDLLMARMMADITAGQMDRFYSITNELGHEISISGSDTDDTDSESEPDESLYLAMGQNIRHPRRSIYSCDLCTITFTRKYKLFAHQVSDHNWDEAPHVCQHCQARFLCEKLLHSHYRHQCKNLLKRYVCRKCPQRFMWKENLKMHLRTMHPDSEEVKKCFAPSSYDCEECSRSFQMQKDLTRHMMTHRVDATVFPCLWCPRKFYRRSNLYLHIKRHGITSHQLSAAASHITACKGPNGIKQIYCRVCNIKFQKLSALRTHLRQETSAESSSHHNYHSQHNYSIMNELGYELDIDDSETDEDDNAKTYKCQMCGLVCKRRYEMSQHQLSVHKHEHITLKCDKCVFRTVTSDIMEHHMRTQCNNSEKLHQCTHCSYKFMWPENLDVHIKLVHPEERQKFVEVAEDVVATSRSEPVPLQEFHCDKCDSRYNRKDRLIAHMKKMHADGDVLSSSMNLGSAKISNEEKKQPKEKKFLCAFCGRAVSSSSNLIVHMRRHTGEKPFQCEFCDKAFPRSSDLACHRRTHTGEKPHRCTVCDKSFSRSYKLHTHMRIHSGERPYKCSFCEKSFTQSNDLALHVRRHTGERPYVCNICNEGFIQGTALKNHRTLRGHFEKEEIKYVSEVKKQPSSVLQLDEEGLHITRTCNMSNNAYSASESDASESADNTFCIFLHLVEGIGLHRRDGVGDFTERHKDKVILTASLNGVKFEVEGHSTETVTIFNSNCIWECELSDIKRMKTDNRPVKLEIFIKSGRTDTSPRRGIGSLLLPIRGVPVIAALKNVQLKLHWHKLNVLSSEWRQNKPEIYLLLVIVKKNLIDNGQFEVFLGKRKGLLNEGISPKSSETSLMLQSQSNVYVQLLEQVGLIQVGNNPDVDCDIFNVTLTFKQVKNLLKVLEMEKNFHRQTSTFVFHYDFLGSTSQLEMIVNQSDCYAINEKVSLTFKSSLKSLRLYFQRIFFIPISIYVNNTVVGNLRLDFSKLLPEDTHFSTSKAFTKYGTFYFDRINKIVSPRMPKPSVDYIFSMQLVTNFSKKLNPEHGPLTEAYASYKIDEKGAADITECYRNLDFPNTLQQKRAPYDPGQISSRNFANFEMYERNYMKMQTDAFIIGRVLGENTELFAKSSEDLCRSTDPLARRLSRPILSNYSDNEQVQSLESISNIEISRASYIPIKPQNRSIGVNTDQLETDPEEMTMKIVRELEEWKAQQMEHFIKGLEQKEVEYLGELNKEWEQQRSILQARLEAKLSECERLNAELEQAHAELNSNALKHQETISIVQTVKQDIERSYAEKFQQLDDEMQRLKHEMQQRATESAEREVEQAQQKCQAADVIALESESEKLEMKLRIDQLEKQLTAMEKTHFSAEQLQGMLADLQKQTERFADIEKAKEYYKAQWSKSARELHVLQMTLLKQKEAALEEKKDVEVDICLEEILEEEQEALHSDRNELKYIKDILYDSLESASLDDLQVD